MKDVWISVSVCMDKHTGVSLRREGQNHVPRRRWSAETANSRCCGTTWKMPGFLVLSIVWEPEIEEVAFYLLPQYNNHDVSKNEILVTGLISVSLLIIFVIANDDAFIKEKTTVFLAQQSERAQWGKSQCFHPKLFVRCHVSGFSYSIWSNTQRCKECIFRSWIGDMQKAVHKSKRDCVWIYFHFYFII